LLGLDSGSALTLKWRNPMTTRTFTALSQGVALAAGGVLLGLWFGHSLNAVLDLFLGA